MSIDPKEVMLKLHDALNGGDREAAESLFLKFRHQDFENALKTSDLPRIKWWMDRGHDINAVHSEIGISALMVAARAFDQEAVSCFLAMGANVDQQDRYDNGVLFHVMDYVWEHGIDNNEEAFLAIVNEVLRYNPEFLSKREDQMSVLDDLIDDSDIYFSDDFKNKVNGLFDSYRENRKLNSVINDHADGIEFGF